jgi:hypothetical protein
MLENRFGLLLLLLLSLVAVSCDNDDDTTDPDDSADGDTDKAGGIDGGSQDCTEDPQAPAGDFNFIVIQKFAAQDQGISLSLAWTIGDGSAVGETFAFDMVRFIVSDDQVNQCIQDDQLMQYTWGHHNWDETLTATTNGREYKVKMVRENIEDNAWVDSLEIRDEQSGEIIEGPVVLEDLGCRTIPPGNPNACVFRNDLDE